MEKIGEEERRIGTTQSSFHPFMYKPARLKERIGCLIESEEQIDSAAPLDLSIFEYPVPTKDSSLFLPCHYFTYIAGTSTGG